ncbi:hypothetical protein [Occallatibacter riparius]|uniref:Uncharacterized protein n=1 Tax=Occallatibacter riparius TaxID=1002689 RepID=A0A9J7BRH2_9BACT|nr:hypothetical protein [Occallatibacter riparius]UWZ85175.1 hypothetical protein MOP44_04340 [Occallatibacter riparius]
MKAKRIPGLLRVIEASELNEIRAVNEQPEVDRQFSSRTPLLNGLLLSKLLGVLSYRGKRFPTMQSRQSACRAHDQNTLWDQLSAKASFFRDGPAELESVAAWLKGIGEVHEVGILLQELVGRAFEPSYKASEESWAAAVTLAAAIQAKNPIKLFSWKITGRIRSARNVLAAKVAGDRAGIHGTGIAIHNLVVALNSMKVLYGDIGLRESLLPEEAVHRSLAAPAAVLRQATAPGSVCGCPFKKGTIFVLKLSEAFKRSGHDGIVFQRGSWNQCPAEQWVPALLAGIWVRATNRR